MLWENLLTAFALMLVLEGIIPFLSPRRWREMMFRVISQNEKNIRTFGFFSMLVGVLLLFFIKN